MTDSTPQPDLRKSTRSTATGKRSIPFSKSPLSSRARHVLKAGIKRNTTSPPRPLKDCDILSKKQEAALQHEYESLDPFILGNRIQRRLRKIEKIKEASELVAVGEFGFPDCPHSLTIPELEDASLIQLNHAYPVDSPCHNM